MVSDPASLLYAPAEPGAREAGARARTAQAANRWIRERRTDAPRRTGVSGPVPETVTVSADGRELTLRFAGTPDVPGPCGADYSVESTQRPDVVAVEIVARARVATPGAKDAACSLIEAARTVTTTLAAPLGDRPVIDTTATAIPR
ncbi:hypothetical protein [Embleya sp. NPDC001921]